MPLPPSATLSITDDAHSPVEQLEMWLRDPHSEFLRRKFFGTLATMNTQDQVEPWLRAARDLYTRGMIDEDGWVYFASMFLECLTFGDVFTDPELVRIEGEIDAFAGAHTRRDDEDDYDVDEDPQMRALCAAYDARAHEVAAACLRDLGYGELADEMERDYDAYLDKSSLGASKLFDGE